MITPVSLRTGDIAPSRAFAIIALVYAVSTAVTAGLAWAVGSPFVLWFSDAPLLLGALLGCLLVLGILWDGLLISAGLLCERFWPARGGARANPPVTVAGVRRIRFFTCGPLPIPVLLATALTVLGTSNITLLNMKLLREATQWRDAFFWQIEAPVLEQLQHYAIDVRAWDRLYHSAWGIETIAAFALVVIGRGPRIVLHYCVTLIVLFYVGRLLGILNPVMGPAFFQPAAFGYLEGSATAEARRQVGGILRLSAEQAAGRGGILLGGVSAMPSLHVAMVSITAYWLAIASHRTLFVTVPWVLAVWTATVVLGWHYMLDGAGGIVLAAASILLTRWLLRVLGPRTAPDASPQADGQPPGG